MENLGKIVQVEEDMPLQTYFIKYQTILHDEAEFKIKKLLEDESLHMAQVITDAEVTWTKNLENQFVNITQGFVDAEISRRHKLKNQLKNSEFISEKLNQKITGAEFNLTK